MPLLMPGIQTTLDFKPMERWRQERPLGALLQQFEEAPQASPSVFEHRMEKLSTLARKISSRFTVINERSAGLLAIESLISTCLFAMNNESPLGARWVWAWPNTVPQLFIGMIGNNSPLILVILAHYAAMTRPFDHQSCVSQGWSTTVLDVVDRGLDSSWKDWILWPKDCVENRHMVDDIDGDAPLVAVAEPGGHAS